jgi:hypothetical protein
VAGGFVLGITLLLLFVDHWRIVVAVLIGLARLTMLARNLLRG